MRLSARAAFAALILLIAAPPAGAFTIERVISPRGIEAWLVRDPTLPIVGMEFAFKGAGALADPVGKEGLARLAAGMLDEGAGDLDAQGFQGRLADLSITMDFSAGAESLSGGLRSRTSTLPEAFRLLRLALTAPRLDPRPLAKVRDQLTNDVRRDERQGRSIASRLFYDIAFPDHAYSRRRGGTEESLAALTDADVRGFLTTRLALAELRIGVVGDITAGDLAKALDDVFGDLPAKAPPLDIPAADFAAAGAILVSDLQGPQSTILFGHTGVSRKDPDYFAAVILSEIMGGGFGSRLTTEIREKRGLTYGVGLGLSGLEKGPLILGSSSTENRNTAEVIALVRREWTRMGAEGPTPEEVESAKAQILGSFWLRLDSARRIASMLVGVQIEDLGIDYPSRRDAIIEGVTMADLKRVAKRLFDPQALAVVVVGRPPAEGPAAVVSNRPPPKG